MTIDSICVLGGTGFVGYSLVARLSRAGMHVRVLTRRRERHRDLLVLPQVEIVEADVHDAQTLKRQFTDRDAVINLVGILNERGHTGAGFRQIHVDLSKKVLAAAKQCGVRRLLQMSALGADQGGPSHYLRTKGEAENHVHTFGQPEIAVTSFRPSVIFGPGDGLFNRFAGLLAYTPVLPLACPDARFAPVYVGDVADRMAAAVTDRETFGGHYDLCGPEDWTLYEIVQYVLQIKGWRRWILPLPGWAGRLQANILEFVPGKPLSRDNYSSLTAPSVCGDQTPRCPTAVTSSVPHYLGEHHRQQRLQELRRQAGRNGPTPVG